MVRTRTKIVFLRPIAQMVKNAKYCRQESERLLQQLPDSETRPLLNPAIDPIPPSNHKKLKNCKTYPLRRCCNYGENEQARWKRCEYMEHSKSPSDPHPWHCCAYANGNTRLPEEVLRKPTQQKRLQAN
jgi:hypothetical protein